MVELPAAVTVGPHRFEIRTDDDTRRQLDGNGKLGETHADLLIINVNTDRPGTAVAETVLHEVLHAVWHVAGIAAEYDTEELVVNAMAPTLLQVLRSNPEMVAALTA